MLHRATRGRIPKALERRPPASPLECLHKWKFGRILNQVREMTQSTKKIRVKLPIPPKPDNRLACKITRYRLNDILADLETVNLTHEPPLTWNAYVGRRANGTQYEMLLIILTEPLPDEVLKAYPP